MRASTSKFDNFALLGNMHVIKLRFLGREEIPTNKCPHVIVNILISINIINLDISVDENDQTFRLKAVEGKCTFC